MRHPISMHRRRIIRPLECVLVALMILALCLAYRSYRVSAAVDRLEASGGKLTEHRTYPSWLPAGVISTFLKAPLAHCWYDVQFARKPVTDHDILPLRDLPGLEWLELHTTAVTGTGLSAIRSHTQLRHLFLNNNPIQDDSLRNISGLHELEWLELSRTQITDRGLRHLSVLTKITRLSLVNTAVTEAGLVHLLPLTRLERLELYGTNVTDDAISVLSKMKSLKELHLRETQFTDSGLEQLRMQLPNCDILP